MIWTRILGIAHFEVIPISKERKELDDWFKRGRPCTEGEVVEISRLRELKHKPLRVDEVIVIQGWLHGYDDLEGAMEWFKERCEQAIHHCDAVLRQAMLLIDKPLRRVALIIYSPSIGWRIEEYDWRE